MGETVRWKPQFSIEVGETVRRKPQFSIGSWKIPNLVRRYFLENHRLPGGSRSPQSTWGRLSGGSRSSQSTWGRLPDLVQRFCTTLWSLLQHGLASFLSEGRFVWLTAHELDEGARSRRPHPDHQRSRWSDRHVHRSRLRFTLQQEPHSDHQQHLYDASERAAERTILHVSMFCESLNACWQENTSILPRNQSTRAGGS
jgi:hypothetical protein